MLKVFALRAAADALSRHYRALECYLISREQRQRFHRAQRAVLRGHVVLFERFPIFPGAGDRGPIERSAKLRALQEPLYREISKPDLIFLLSVQAGEATRRKPDHDPRQIEAGKLAFESFLHAHEGDPGVVRLDGSAPLGEIVNGVMEHVERELQANH